LGRTVTDFLDYLVVEAGLSENTVLAYGRDLREFLRFCQDSQIDKMEDVKPWLVRKYFGPRAATETDVPKKKIGAANRPSAISNPQFLSENSAKRALVAIRMFLRFAKLRRLIEDDGSEVLDTPKTWQRLPAVCNKQQVLRLLEAPAAEETFYLRDKALLGCSRHGAASSGESQTTDVNLDIGTCAVSARATRNELSLSVG
jgi:site-specific recombinase XerD